MSADFRQHIYPLAPGIVLALLSILFGFILGGAFGLVEDQIHQHLEQSGQAVLSTVYHDKADALQKVVDKSWNYFIRAHLHANGIGTAVLAMILLLAHLPANRTLKQINAWMLGLGSLGYSFFWLWAGLRAPGLGSTGAAKESLRWLAIPSAGMLILGLLLALATTLWAWQQTRHISSPEQD